MPNGSLLKQNLLYGVINVVNNLDCLARGICQNPLLASNLLKTCARVVSTFGMGCISHRTLSFSGLRSTQMWTAPDSFRTTTLAAHQEVGFSSEEITPRFSIRSSSSFTFFLSGMGTFLGVHKANGWLFGCSFISYSCENYPNPVNKARYRDTIDFSTEHTLDKNFSSIIAGSPRRLFFSPFITYTVCTQDF